MMRLQINALSLDGPAAAAARFQMRWNRFDRTKFTYIRQKIVNDRADYAPGRGRPRARRLHPRVAFRRMPARLVSRLLGLPSPTNGSCRPVPTSSSTPGDQSSPGRGRRAGAASAFGGPRLEGIEAPPGQIPANKSTSIPCKLSPLSHKLVVCCRRITVDEGNDRIPREGAMVYREDRVVWGAVLFRTTNPEVIGGAIIRRSERLHWTNQAAKEEVLKWTQELRQTDPAGNVEWQSAEDVIIGRFANDLNHVAVIRSMLLPVGKAPRMK